MSAYRVVIIGAGFSGIVMGARLRAAGITDLVILEKNDQPGGTWRDNRYPGCACDVPSALYTLADAPNPRWSRDFAGWEEIRDYLVECIDRFGLRDALVCGADVTSATWDETGQRWVVRSADGREWTGGALVLGVGGLHIAKRPDIAGLGAFAGPILHTADWPQDDSVLDGARVGIIGTGASAVQAVPRLARRASTLTVFQRSASWILPRHDGPWSARRQALLDRFPAAYRAMRWGRLLKQDAQVIGFGRFGRLRELLQRRSLATLHRTVSDPVVRDRLTPRYEIGCKRILLSDDYWPTFARDDVELVVDPIRQVTPHGIMTQDGVERPLDVLVLATGFDTIGSYERMEIRGLRGRTLAQAWSAGRPTRLGIATAGFPELYLLLGPNTALGHSSVLLMIESAADYIVRRIRAAESAGPHTVTEAAQRRFGRWVQRRLARTVFASGCDSWYLDDAGRNVTIWPGTTLRYRLATSRPDDRSYERVG